MWPLIFQLKNEIVFAHTNFKWANLANHNAVVTVAIIGISNQVQRERKIFSISDDQTVSVRTVENINAYLIGAPSVEIQAYSRPISGLSTMQFGNHPYYAAALIFSMEEGRTLRRETHAAERFIRPLYGAYEFISALPRACLWIKDHEADEALQIPQIARRVAEVAAARQSATRDLAAQKLAKSPHRFRDQFECTHHLLVMPRVSSENRPYLPVGLLHGLAVVQDQADRKSVV